MVRAVAATAAATEVAPRAVERIVTRMRAIATNQLPKTAMRLKHAGAVLVGPAGVPTLAATLAPRVSPWSTLVLLIGGVGVDRLVLHAERALQRKRLQPPVGTPLLVASAARLEVALHAPSSGSLALGMLLGLVLLTLVVLARARQNLQSVAERDAAKHETVTEEPVDQPVRTPTTNHPIPSELTEPTMQGGDDPVVKPRAAKLDLGAEPVATDEASQDEESPIGRRYDNLRRLRHVESLETWAFHSSTRSA